MLSRYTLLGGRRQGTRRADDCPRAFADRHGPRLLLVMMTVVALNTLDACFTAYLLSHGGEELNPLMDALARTGTGLFIACKSLVIAICTVILSITKNYRVTRIGLAVVILFYTGILAWHLYLVAWLGL